jgi:hypothetical protein
MFGILLIYAIREPETPYGNDFDPENDDLRQENVFHWDVSV